MIINDDKFVNQMTKILEEDILFLQNNYIIISENKIFSSIEKLAFQRLTDVKNNFPYFILFLVEPFLDYINEDKSHYRHAKDCGYVDEMNNVCPVCGSTNIKKLRRVTGYLTGDYKEAFNYGKQCETEDRVKHIKEF